MGFKGMIRGYGGGLKRILAKMEFKGIMGISETKKIGNKRIMGNIGILEAFKS
jgi:hypothetical protein